MKKIIIVLTAIILLFSSCKKAEGEDAPEIIPIMSEAEAKPEPEEDPQPQMNNVTVTKLDGKGINPLTGGIIDKKDSELRPYAVLINNYARALPQSGIGQADIFYEALAEGGITRILAVFNEYDVEKIGPVRSARHYFIDFAYDNDALFVHHGRSPQANDSLNKNRVENLDGMELEGTAFWRDKERLATSGMYEHSSYTNSVNLLEAIERKNYRIDKPEDFNYIFDFNNVDTKKGEDHEDEINIVFSDAQKVRFVYDESTKMYERYQNGSPHIDELTGETIKVKNILIQYANVYVIPGDSEGRRNIETVSNGTGVLYTNGAKRDVKWSKKGVKAPTDWVEQDGEKIKVNKGKTWICVMGK